MNESHFLVSFRASFPFVPHHSRAVTLSIVVIPRQYYKFIHAIPTATTAPFAQKGSVFTPHNDNVQKRYPFTSQWITILTIAFKFLRSSPWLTFL